MNLDDERYLLSLLMTWMFVDWSHIGMDGRKHGFPALCEGNYYALRTLGSETWFRDTYTVPEFVLYHRGEHLTPSRSHWPSKFRQGFCCVFIPCTCTTIYKILLVPLGMGAARNVPDERARTWVAHFSKIFGEEFEPFAQTVWFKYNKNQAQWLIKAIRWGGAN